MRVYYKAFRIFGRLTILPAAVLAAHAPVVHGQEAGGVTATVVDAASQRRLELLY